MSGYPSSPAEREDPRLHPRMAADEKAKEALAELVSGGDRPAWAGTPPAEGTRRGLIRDAIERTFAGKVFPTDFDGYNELYLDLADAIELALLGSGDDKREADAQEAINAVGEALDRIDAPQGATYAERIDRLYSEGRDGRRELVDAGNEFDRISIPRSTGATGEPGTPRTLTLAERAAICIRRVLTVGETDA